MHNLPPFTGLANALNVEGVIIIARDEETNFFSSYRHRAAVILNLTSFTTSLVTSSVRAVADTPHS